MLMTETDENADKKSKEIFSKLCQWKYIKLGTC